MKKVAGTIAFTLLLFVPSEKAMAASMGKALGVWALCIGIAIVLLACIGAFKRRTSTPKISKS
jgi:hypothetical protein